MLYRLLLYVVLAVFNVEYAGAITISASTPAVYKIYMPPQESTHKGFNLTFKLRCTAPSGYIAKWTSKGKTNTGNFTMPCDPDGTPWDTGFVLASSSDIYDLAFDINITPNESSGIPAGVDVEWQLYEDQFGTVQHNQKQHSAEITPAQSCSVDVNSTPTIPDIVPGKSVNAVTLTSLTIGSGHLTFRPDTHDENGGLLKGDTGGSLSYSVIDSESNSNWNTADAQWQGDLTQHYSVKLGDIPLSTTPGTYTGTMTATISCE